MMMYDIYDYPQKYIKIWRQDLWTDASIQIYFSLIFKEPGRDLAWCPPDELRAKRQHVPVQLANLGHV